MTHCEKQGWLTLFVTYRDIYVISKIHSQQNAWIVCVLDLTVCELTHPYPYDPKLHINELIVKISSCAINRI